MELVLRELVTDMTYLLPRMRQGLVPIMELVPLAPEVVSTLKSAMVLKQLMVPSGGE